LEILPKQLSSPSLKLPTGKKSPFSKKSDSKQTSSDEEKPLEKYPFGLVALEANASGGLGVISGPRDGIGISGKTPPNSALLYGEAISLFDRNQSDVSVFFFHFFIS
jgi:hypothetical protein